MIFLIQIMERFVLFVHRLISNRCWYRRPNRIKHSVADESLRSFRRNFGILVKLTMNSWYFLWTFWVWYLRRSLFSSHATKYQSGLNDCCWSAQPLRDTGNLCLICLVAAFPIFFARLLWKCVKNTHTLSSTSHRWISWNRWPTPACTYFHPRICVRSGFGFCFIFHIVILDDPLNHIPWKFNLSRNNFLLCRALFVCVSVVPFFAIILWIFFHFFLPSPNAFPLEICSSFVDLSSLFPEFVSVIAVFAIECIEVNHFIVSTTKNEVVLRKIDLLNCAKKLIANARTTWTCRK